ncbi:hypothetical protein N8I77_002940 [Diaporthe amygdali]|uniref:Uncharacterized protein n=1 Tax=Phomopsis amygdali TaxID=1214568 RepID=A0AAD9W6A0_PHOAM|nr:hypothetical protein N8I77_002940 [Diaporthe amygdali]
MCFQVLELYSACRCLYYQHAVDRCPEYGKRGHNINQRKILVGYACFDHSRENAQYCFNEPSGQLRTVAKDKAPRKSPARSQKSSSNEIPIEIRTPKWIKTRSKLNPKDLKSSPLTAPSPASEASAPVNVTSLARTTITAGKQLDTPTAFEITKHADHHVRGTDSRHEEVGDYSDSHPLATPSQTDNFEDYVFAGGIETDSESCLSDESVESETESISSLISTNTTVDSDATEAIFRRLLLFRDLKYLWPQLLVRCGSRSMGVITIERFMRRYSEDLAGCAVAFQDAESGICLAASQFVRKSRLNIAHRIWKAHDEGSDDHEEAENDSADRAVDNIDTEKIEDDHDKNFVYDLSERFLFETTPILALEANVKAFVGFPHPGVDGIASRLLRSAEVWFSNVGCIIHEPALEPGKRRVRWTCNCGMKLYDDYIELQPGAISKIEQLLGDYFHTVHGTDESLNPSVPSKVMRQGPIFSWSAKFLSALWPFKNKDSSLPRHQPSKRTAEELGTCPLMPETPQMDHNFVLLCVPFMRWASKLWQAEICRINSDRDFFRILRHYYNNHGKRPWAWLRKVQAVHFVKFEMYQSQLVDIQRCPDVPSESQAHNTYSFDPLPAETNPPIGPNLLTHLLEHPEDAEVLPVLYRKFPKKLRAKLQACPQKGSAVGWGVQFVEGLNWFAVFLCGCSGFLAALILATIWSLVRSDVQGGFAIAGFMLAFLGFCMGIAKTEIQTT